MLAFAAERADTRDRVSLSFFKNTSPLGIPPDCNPAGCLAGNYTFLRLFSVISGIVRTVRVFGQTSTRISIVVPDRQHLCCLIYKTKKPPMRMAPGAFSVFFFILLYISFQSSFILPSNLPVPFPYHPVLWQGRLLFSYQP